METNEYASGRLVDVFGDATDPVVLLWHGTQTDARAVLRPFATLLADHGFYVIVPDWDSHAADRGRDDLLGSLRYAAAAGTFALIGWSLGGTAAAGVALHADHYGSPVSRVITLAGAFGATNPLTGESLPTGDLPTGARIPITLLHGMSDDVVPLTASEDFAAALDDWPRELITFDADHGSIAGAIYDADADRYCPADDSATLDVAGEIVDRISAILRQP
ncbi:alpha/beta fold hydrolase [Williamsia sp. 1135]|uniref:alpha/beta hydrolase family protein n=1 Tax=Williamsia sp. 1135 TaxID=1889262 RepID=UPI000A10F518|nr:alpha/beta fold hydrolase [Williamsia sp. 1135]ORM36703.1 esterase [Williamsia sp. 1135]